MRPRPSPLAVPLGFTLVLFLAACGDEAKEHDVGRRPPVLPLESVPAAEKPWVPLVDGDAVLKRTKAILDWGPRPSGSDAIKNVRLEIKGQLAAIGIPLADVKEQSFTDETPSPPTSGRTEFVNIVGIIRGSSPDGILISAHYDSKYLPQFRFVGANDAAAAVALVLELGKILVNSAKTAPRPLSIYLAFFDGEEAIVDWMVGKDHTYGSRRLAKQGSEILPGKIRAAINLDMIGAKDLFLADDTNSDHRLRKIFKGTSTTLFGRNLFNREFAVTDDHLEFKQAGIPAIDLIDSVFEQSSWWHQPKDTVEIIDPRSLARVGTLVLTALPAVESTF